MKTGSRILFLRGHTTSSRLKNPGLDRKHDPETETMANFLENMNLDF